MASGMAFIALTKASAMSTRLNTGPSGASAALAWARSCLDSCSGSAMPRFGSSGSSDAPPGKAMLSRWGVTVSSTQRVSRSGIGMVFLRWARHRGAPGGR